MKRLTRDFCIQTVAAFVKAGLCPPSCRVRLCGVEDLPALLAIGTECFAYNTPTRGETRYALSKGHAAVIALDDPDGGMIGYAVAEAHAGRQSIYLNTVAVLPAYRGKGLGTVLYDVTAFLTKRAGAKAIWCHVAEDNKRGIHLLERTGYEIVREEADYYEDGKTAIVMRKKMAA